MTGSPSISAEAIKSWCRTPVTQKVWTCCLVSTIKASKVSIWRVYV